MKAIVVTRRGSPDGLELREVPKPSPKANEILVKVHAATVTRGDAFLRKLPPIVTVPVGLLFGFKAQKIPGVEFAGVVEETGERVTRFKVGDEVFGTTTGLGFGANAEYVSLPETPKKGVVASKPASLSFEEAAAVPVGGMTALYFLRQADLSAGQKALVYGASGSVGSYAVQFAKGFGAEVTGVCSTGNVAMVRALGADKVVDYTKEDLSRLGETYDLVFDAVGKLSRSARRNLLGPGGRYLSIRSLTRETSGGLLFIQELADAGKLSVVIDRTYPLEQTAEAHRYVETGRKKGNVVIRVAATTPPERARAVTEPAHVSGSAAQ